MSINVTRSSMPDFEEYCAEIRELWDSRWLTNNGAKHKKLQATLEEYLAVPHVTLYTNGHLALENALEAYDFAPGAEIITTPFTFVSTTNSITRKGLVPVFCDINRENYTIDVTKIEALITERTVAIMPVHVYGSLCDTEAIDRIAKKHGLRVIYDAAHAFGVTKNGRSAADFGDATMFSFHATKVFHTIEGGALCYREDALVPRLDAQKNFGCEGADCLYAGGNAKMSEFQAAMGICNLRHLKGEIEKRRAATLRYRERLADVPGIRLLPEQEGVVSNYAYMPALFDGYRYTRDEVFDRLLAQDIVARKYFAPQIPDFTAYADHPADTPVSREIASKILTLPLFADLTLDDVDRICDIILK